MRKILYVTGTRADFGLMLLTLRTIAADPALQLQICVTGMHLSQRFGLTVREVEASGLDIVSRIAVDVDTDSGLGMGKAAGVMLSGFSETFAQHRPDIVLLLGDRTEMLAGTIAAVCLGIPVAHIHGGERSGTIDESIRHAISKLAHLHLVATTNSRNRLIAMGENPSAIIVVGAPGLVGIHTLVNRDRQSLLLEHGLKTQELTALILFHPVVQESDLAGEQMSAVLTAVHNAGYQAICLLPNADVGNSRIRQAIESFCAKHPAFRSVSHLARNDFVSLMACCDLMIGNSSSGIIEAASFGTPVVNVGDRQNLRERNRNVIDTTAKEEDLCSAIKAARKFERKNDNIYQRAETDKHISSALKETHLDVNVLKKFNCY
jgi:GDP/UDP-N,N'-diacetylbacillosamine 2-epimerase (hydrolysing)